MGASIKGASRWILRGRAKPTWRLDKAGLLMEGYFPSPPQYGEGEADQQGAETAPCAGEVGTYTTSSQYPLTLGSCRCLYSRTAEKSSSRKLSISLSPPRPRCDGAPDGRCRRPRARLLPLPGPSPGCPRA